MRRNKNKLGHQAPKGYRVNRFNSIEISGDLHYCQSHNFVFNSEVEYQKLHWGLPCYYTDNRYYSTKFNFYKNTYIHWTRFKDISLKACIRKTLDCRNIPVGTVVEFRKSWYTVGKRIDNSFRFKVRKENRFDPDYQISKPSYSRNFSTCEFSKELTNKLRENGFLVSVHPNESFLLGMINTAKVLTGKQPDDIRIEGEIAYAYGHNKIIGFSSYDNDFMGYSDGVENVLWDEFGEFDKWSRCNLISKKTSIDKIVDILKDDN